MASVPRSAARSVVGYNLGRLALLLVCLVLGYVAGLRSVTLLIVALLVSGVLSYFLLARARIDMAKAVTDVVTHTRQRVARRTAEEDAYVDALLTEKDVTRPDR